MSGAPVPRPDGRQSPVAAAIQRGVLRHLAMLGLSGLTEFPLASGRRADVLALDAKGQVTIVEIKSCVADFRADLKWPEYRAFCDRLLFAVPLDFPLDLLPEETGLLVADAFGAEMLRPPPLHPMLAPARKAITLSFARIGARRLAALYDPEFRHDIP